MSGLECFNHSLAKMALLYDRLALNTQFSYSVSLPGAKLILNQEKFTNFLFRK